MAARMRRDFEAVDRTEAAAAMAEVREWERVVAEAAEGRVKYRGVRKVTSGKYRAQIKHPVTKTQVWLGTFEAALVAACAYDLEARRLQGHKARPNFAYAPPPCLVSAVAATPRRRGHSHPAPPAPPAPVSAPFVGHFSEPAPFQAYPSPHVQGTARARIVLPAPETGITGVRSISAAAAASCPFYDPVNLFVPPMDMVAPANSAETCLSSTVDLKLRDSASSSYRGRPLMLKKPKVMAVPTTTSTTPTNANCDFTDDEYEAAVPYRFL